MPKEILSSELASLATEHLVRVDRLVEKLTAHELKFGSRSVEPIGSYSETLIKSGVLYTNSLRRT